MIDADDMSRRSKMNNESSREIQMVITFHSEVRFRLGILHFSFNTEHKHFSQGKHQSGYCIIHSVTSSVNHTLIQSNLKSTI